jgi:hypothetical protein
MPEDNSTPKKPSLSPDKLIQGVLSKIGGMFDAIVGRKAKASSSLATSELVARTKRLLDSQVRDTGENGRFVPHIINLKVEWGKFDTESKESLKTLENEILAAVIDHMNDNRYLTYAPLKVTAKPDYFTSGIHIITSFGETEKEDDEVDLSVTMPHINVKDLIAKAEVKEEKPKVETVFAKFSLNGQQKELRLSFETGERLNVGRTRENDLALEDGSVSKLHAALSVNPAGELIVADTGSTNGTFINKERLAYGKAFPVKEGDMVSFGNVNVLFEHLISEPEPAVMEQISDAAETEEMEGPIRIELE